MTARNEGYVYAILDPVTRAPRYVGMTRARDQEGIVKKRMSQARSRTRFAQTPFAEWLRTLDSKNPPELKVIARGPSRELPVLRAVAIKMYSEEGVDLLNAKLGRPRRVAPGAET